MKPLVKAAFYTGLCPIGDPPEYKPSRRTVARGIVIGVGLMVGVGFILVSEFMFVYHLETQARASAGGNVTTGAPLQDTAEANSQLNKILTVCSGSALFLAYCGLFIGHFRKVEHLPRVFQLGDALPGKARWKTSLFVVELSVFTFPVSGHVLKSYYESRGVSHVDAFALLGVLYCIEKFMLLHLVARVGIGFDAINKQLEAVGEEQKTAKGSSEAFCDALRLLRQHHMDTCELLELITRAYEVQVLTFLVSEFVLSVLVVYLQARKMYQGQMHWLDLIGLVFMVLVTQLTTLTYSTCGDTSQKGNRTAALVHKMLNSGHFQGEQVQQLIFFSMQTMHHKISVSPYDAVTMDYSLLKAMLGSVAMHIVILVQFNISGSGAAATVAPPTPRT